MTSPSLAAICRRPVTTNSRESRRIATQAGNLPSRTSITIAARTISLSASGSRNLPMTVTRPIRPASQPATPSAIQTAAHTAPALGGGGGGEQGWGVEGGRWAGLVGPVDEEGDDRDAPEGDEVRGVPKLLEQHPRTATLRPRPASPTLSPLHTLDRGLGHRRGLTSFVTPLATHYPGGTLALRPAALRGSACPRGPPALPRPRPAPR